jgi:two-component system, LuxR family, response regulator FixJ
MGGSQSSGGIALGVYSSVRADCGQASPGEESMIALECTSEPGGGLHPQQLVHVISDNDDARRIIQGSLISAGFDVRTYHSASFFLQNLPTLEPRGCVLTDFRLSEADTLQVFDQLPRHGPRYPVIVLIAHGDVSSAVAAMKAGAFEVIERPFLAEALPSVVRRTLDRSEIPSFGTAIDTRLAAARTLIESLTQREREVLQMVMEGRQNKAIAHALGISVRTVEVHRTRLMGRLGVRTVAEAVRLAVWAELALDASRFPSPKLLDQAAAVCNHGRTRAV